MQVGAILLALAAGLFGPGVLKLLGLSAPSGDTGTTGRVYVLPDHPAAVTATPAAPTTPAAPAAPAAPGTAPAAPPVKQIAADIVRQPWTVWGLAFAGLTLPLVISQLRAAAHEAGSSAADVYNEGRRVYKRSENADEYTDNKSRRA